MSIEMRDPIYIEESAFVSPRPVDKHDELILVNFSEKEIDENMLYNSLKSIVGADKLEWLTISWSSSLKSAEVIRAFPNLKRLSVCGRNITSLDGLEWFGKGEFIDIDTEKNRKRNIKKIADLQVEGIYLSFGNREDFNAISKCRFLKKLTLHKSPSPEFNEWGDVRLSF